MSRDHRCTGDVDTCGTCRARQEAAETEPYTDRELDDMAEAEARNMIYGRRP